MPNDAKLGLVAGVAVVVLIATLFFRKDAPIELSSPSALPSRTATPSPPAVPRAPSLDSDLPPPPLPDPPSTGAS